MAVVAVGDFDRPAIEALVKKYGTPLYIYSQATLENHYQKLDRAMASVDHQICFAVKSNSNLAVLHTLADLGSGFDIVSAGELQRVIAAGLSLGQDLAGNACLAFSLAADLDTALKVFVGSAVTPNLGWEASYIDFGSKEAPRGVTTEAWGLGASLVGVPTANSSVICPRESMLSEDIFCKPSTLCSCSSCGWMISLSISDKIDQSG